MPPKQPSLIGYAGRDAFYEQILPDEPDENALERERLEIENSRLKGEIRDLQHLKTALEICAKVLQPFLYRLNGRQP